MVFFFFLNLTAENDFNCSPNPISTHIWHWVSVHFRFWMKQSSGVHPEHPSITYMHRHTHSLHHLCNTCQIAPLRAQSLDRCVHSRRIFRSHRPTCHLFIYIFNVTTCPSGIAVSQFPQWENQTVGSGSSERWPLLGSQEVELCALDGQMLSAAEGTGARREGHRGPKSSICFYQLLFNACKEPLHPPLPLPPSHFLWILDLF